MRNNVKCLAVLVLMALTTLSRAGDIPFRPPAVPLVAHDPYFSIWSPADELTGADTVHWTGKPQRLTSLARIDGQAFRLIGASPADLPAFPQIGVRVWPTRTICRFANDKVQLTLTFLTPALPGNLELLARPVTVLTWAVSSVDGRDHAVQLECGMSAEVAVNTPDQPVTWASPEIDGFLVRKVGSKAQRVLARKGDDLRMDWGYAYMAAPVNQKPEVIGIGGYSQLCEMSGKHDDARKYVAIARDYARKWQTMAGDDGHTRLAYDQPGTWGMKHNLIWDRILGLNLFPDSIADAELAWYLKVQKKYGLPVDNRTDTSLIDWALWSIAPARSIQEFEELVDPIFRYADETPSRVPLSDWFVTTDGRQRGFQARPVVGGLFIRLLADRPSWIRRVKQAAKVSGEWAPFPASKPVTLRELVPTARLQPVLWRYTLDKPGDDWFKPDFDDSLWKQAPAGFGSEGTPGAVVRSEWRTDDIWLRREFTLPDTPLKDPVLWMHYDESPDIYLNGVLAAALDGYVTEYGEVEIDPAARATLKPGRNLLAVHCRQTTGGQYIDVGLSDREEAAPAGPMHPASP